VDGTGVENAGEGTFIWFRFVILLFVILLFCYFAILLFAICQVGRYFEFSCSAEG
jgi:hypothetical protein